MKCHVCGNGMHLMVTDLPFKVGAQTIVIFKELPVIQCENCGEYMLGDSVMERVEQMLDKVDKSAELEIVRYAA